MKKHLISLCKGMRLDEITTDQVRRLIDIKSRELSMGTVERIIALLSRHHNRTVCSPAT